MEKIGIFGGTFDPPHVEHENIIKRVQKQFSLDRIIILPNRNPPHKNSVTPYSHRYEMSKLVFDYVDDFELKNAGLSYTYITLEHFKKRDRELYLILGQDSLNDISGWKHPERIFASCKIICVGRGDKAKACNEEILLCNEPCSDVSSTDIRIMLEYGMPCNQISESVLGYIEHNKLYMRYLKYVQAAKKYLHEKRFEHTAHVTMMAFKLAKIHNLKIDSDELFIATCLHDIAKNLPVEVSRVLIGNGAEYISDKILHQDAGGIFAKSLFPNLSKNIMNAISKHTTFSSDMNDLDKIVALADSIEQTRDYDGVDEIRKQAESDINKAIFMCIENTIKKESVIDERTLLARKFFKEKLYG